VLGISRLAYGAVMAANSLAYIGGTWLCRRLLLKHGLRRTVKLGGGLSLLGGLSCAALSLAGLHTLWAVVLPQWVYSVGHGIHQPCGQAGAVGPFPEKAGAAAALSGFTMMVTAFCVGLWVGHHIDGTVYPLTLGLGVMGCSVALTAWTLVQWHGDPHASAAHAATVARRGST